MCKIMLQKYMGKIHATDHVHLLHVDKNVLKYLPIKTYNRFNVCIILELITTVLDRS